MPPRRVQFTDDQVTDIDTVDQTAREAVDTDAKAADLLKRSTKEIITIDANSKIGSIFKHFTPEVVNDIVSSINKVEASVELSDDARIFLDTITGILQDYAPKERLVPELNDSEQEGPIQYSKFPVDLASNNVYYSSEHQTLNKAIAILKKIDPTAYSNFQEYQTKYNDLPIKTLLKFLLDNVLENGYKNKEQYSIRDYNEIMFNMVVKFPKPELVSYQNLVAMYKKYHVPIVIKDGIAVNKVDLLTNIMYSQIPPIDRYSSRLRNQLAATTVVHDPKVQNIASRYVNTMIYDKLTMNYGDIQNPFLANFIITDNNKTGYGSNTYIYGTGVLQKHRRSGRMLPLWGLRTHRVITDEYIQRGSKLGQTTRVFSDMDLEMSYISYFASFTSQDGEYRYGFIPKHEYSKFREFFDHFITSGHYVAHITALLQRYNYSLSWSLLGQSDADAYVNHEFNRRLLEKYKIILLIGHVLTYMYYDMTLGIKRQFNKNMISFFKDPNIITGLYKILEPVYNLMYPSAYVSDVIPNGDEVYADTLQHAVFLKTFFKHTFGDGFRHKYVPLSNHAYETFQMAHPKGNYFGFKKAINTRKSFDEFMSVSHDSWKEYIIAYACNNFALNKICQSFAHTFGIVHFSDPHNTFTDSSILYEKQKRGHIANEIVQELRKVKDKAAIWGEEVGVEEDKHTLPEADIIFHHIHDQLDDTIAFIDDRANLSTEGTIFASVNIGRSFYHACYLCKDDNSPLREYYKFLNLVNSDGAPGSEYFAKLIFEYIYAIFCLNSVLGVVHGDLHSNNITVGERVFNSAGIDHGYTQYVIGDVKYKFPYTDVYGGIIDFSRSSLQMEKIGNLLFKDKYKKYNEAITNQAAIDKSIETSTKMLRRELYGADPSIDAGNFTEDKFDEFVATKEEIGHLTWALSLFDIWQCTSIILGIMEDDYRDYTKHISLLNKIIITIRDVIANYDDYCLASKVNELDHPETYHPLAVVLKSVFKNHTGKSDNVVEEYVYASEFEFHYDTPNNEGLVGAFMKNNPGLSDTDYRTRFLDMLRKS